MSRDHSELVRLAREASDDARARLQRLPAHAAQATRALAREHAWLVAGGALAIGLLGTATSGRSRRTPERASTCPSLPAKSWSMLLSGLALRLLPGFLSVLGRPQEQPVAAPGSVEAA